MSKSRAEYESSTEVEKSEVVHDNNAGSLENGGAYDAAATNTLLRRLDWHIVPFLSLLYL